MVRAWTRRPPSRVVWGESYSEQPETYSEDPEDAEVVGPFGEGKARRADGAVELAEGVESPGGRRGNAVAGAGEEAGRGVEELPDGPEEHAEDVQDVGDGPV